MRVTFWGVRGTFPATGARYIRYGGDTMCIEVMCGPERLILDAGSGLRNLGESLMRQDAPTRAHVLLSHAHFDHLIGFLQFAPLWRPSTQITVWAMAGPEGDPNTAVRALMKPPFTPEAATAYPAQVEWRSVTPEVSFEPFPGAAITPFIVNHPGEACGYRIDHRGRALAYITDHEHGEPETDARLLRMARGADLIIYDATYTEDEIRQRRGWGHSTWQAGMELRNASAAKLVAFAHHEPRRGDDELDQLARAAAKAGANALFAREGLEIEL